jgi:hypothetical protein
MTHARQTIRAAVVAQLLAANIPVIGARVFGSVFVPFSPKDLPVICVFPEDEAIRVGAMGSPELDREVHVVVKIIASAALNVEDDVDEYCAAVETELDGNLGGAVYDGRLFEVRFERSGEGEAEIMSAEMVYAFKYMTADGDPTATTH